MKATGTTLNNAEPLFTEAQRRIAAHLAGEKISPEDGAPNPRRARLYLVQIIALIDREGQ